MQPVRVEKARAILTAPHFSVLSPQSFSSLYTPRVPHFDIPLDLPHAGRVADRILSLLERHCEENGVDAPELLEAAERVSNALFRYTDLDDNPPDALRIRDAVAVLARALVDEMERSHIAGDRLGQYVRNLFECLELGEEGAVSSLRAGENPASLQRPV